MFTNEDKCVDCKENLTFYGLTYRFKGGRCYNCSQSNKASQSNKYGKITESLKGNKRRVGKRLSIEHARKWITAVSRGYISYHESPKIGRVLCRSSWEKEAFELLDNDPKVKSYKSEPFGIPYMCEGIERYYYPDLLIEYIDSSKELVEIKPSFRLLTVKVQLKLLAATKWSLENKTQFSVWTEHELAILRILISPPS
jgi:hypothetical protein